MEQTSRPKIVIIGGGFGGVELAKRLKKAPVDVVLVDRHNYHTFQPLLYQVAIGAIEADSVRCCRCYSDRITQWTSGNCTCCYTTGTSFSQKPDEYY